MTLYERDLVAPEELANAPKEAQEAYSNSQLLGTPALGHSNLRGFYVFVAPRLSGGREDGTPILVWQERTPRLSKILTCEMTQAEWDQMRDEWIEQYTHDLVIECGNDPGPHLKDVAELQWERYCGQEGWTARDEYIIMARDEALE